MAEHSPILSQLEVQAAFQVGKAQRLRLLLRPVRPQPKAVRASVFVSSGFEDGHGCELRCPLGNPGDRLRGRETFAHLSDFRGKDPGSYAAGCEAFFAADYYGERLWHDDCSEMPWRSAATMPTRLSRITLEVKAVRVVRLKSLSDNDAIAAGCSVDKVARALNREWSSIFDPAHALRLWWDHRWEEKGLGWAKDPWAWAVGVEVLDG